MKILPLKSVSEILVGYQSRARIEHVPSGTHKIIQGRDFLSLDKLCTDMLLRFSPEHTPELYTVKSEDILFQARGTEHFAYFISDPPSNTLASSSFYIIRLKSKILMPHYLAWWINQPPAQRYLKNKSQSTNIPFVSKAVLSDLEIQIPYLRIQETIHHITDLLRKETLIRKQIEERRKQLITLTCMAAIKKQGA